MNDDLGKKMICQAVRPGGKPGEECGTRFFDMGKPKVKCPRCGSGKVVVLDTVKIKERKETPIPVIEPEEEVPVEIEEDDAEETETDELSPEEDQFGEEEDGVDEMEEAEEPYESDEL